MKPTFTIAAACLALTAAFGSQSALATTQITMAGQWYAFDVAPELAQSFGTEWIDINDGSALSFSFNGPATLTVVDAAFSGDRFRVYDNGVLLGETGAAVNSYPNSIGLDFDGALGNANFSRGSFTLGSGNHLITGLLSASALDDTGTPINATVGGLNITPVPEPESYALMLAGLALLAARRRAK